MIRLVSDNQKPEQSFDRQQMSDLTDKSLMRRLKEGSEDAATALYLRYAQRLQQLTDAQVSPGMAVRVDPEGVVQSVFRTFFRRTASGQYEVAEKEDLWKLLLVMALNKIRSAGSFHRAAKRDLKKTQALPGQIDDSADGNETALTILKLTVAEVVGDLPEDQREIVWLRIEGHEVAEIAEKTGRAKRSVERILQTFRQKLSDSIVDGP
jgi:RNA polymerase sigma-70 factor, ECF subfamily